MDDAEDVDTLREGPIEDEHLFEARHPEDSERLKPWIFNPGSPSHVWLGGNQGEGAVRGIEEAESDIQACVLGKVIGVVVKIAVGFRLYDVSGNHRVPVLWCRSMSR